MTIHQVYRQLLAQLYTLYDNREAANISDLVIEHVTGQRKIDRIMYKDLPVSIEQETRINEIAEQLLVFTPVQYVLNEVWFSGLAFYVDRHVLIPRPETEELVDWITRDITSEASQQPKTIIDIGTGSGCIPVTLQKKLPWVNTTGIDVSPEALKIARKNAGLHVVKVHFEHLDFLSSHERERLDRFDIIVSNPPYIKLCEAALMHQNVLAFEPHLALFVPDDKALLFYEAIALFGKDHLNLPGFIYVEINEQHGKEVSELFRNQGYQNITLKKDLQGKDRMLRAEYA